MLLTETGDKRKPDEPPDSREFRKSLFQFQVREWDGVLWAVYELRGIWWKYLSELCADEFGGNSWKCTGCRQL